MTGVRILMARGTPAADERAETVSQERTGPMERRVRMHRQSLFLLGVNSRLPANWPSNLMGRMAKTEGTEGTEDLGEMESKEGGQSRGNPLVAQADRAMEDPVAAVNSVASGASQEREGMEAICISVSRRTRFKR